MFYRLFWTKTISGAAFSSAIVTVTTDGGDCSGGLPVVVTRSINVRSIGSVPLEAGARNRGWALSAASRVALYPLRSASIWRHS